MEIFVGTSGWSYDWNIEGTLSWYVKNSGLNCIELNASFYRFPFPNQVKSWTLKGKSLRWIVKVNQLITHKFKFNEKAFTLWKKFENLFEPLDDVIDFYLFQLPPMLSPQYSKKLEDFIKKCKLGTRFALEVRNIKWFNEEWVKWASGLGITWVSVDSPEHPRKIFSSNGIVYVRMHGRQFWYSHYYEDEELEEIGKNILKIKPLKAYVLFNNNTNMLENGRRMFGLLKRLL
ncbi:MAG: DUF72 domain-containing protein [Nitrososphaeria archaeon]|nr:DUF72 domain-containing protein [Nitrososphaeria archaeon]